MPVGFVSMGHGDAASLAELRVFSDHTLGDFRYIWDDVGAKPHRIGRASLADLRRALGRGAAQADKEQSDRQRQPADEMHGPQHTFVSLMSAWVSYDGAA
jgi:hypothetical protein